MGAPAFRSLVLDVDSTLSGIEGIDWLAAQRGDSIAREISALTRNAMQGGLPLEDVYGKRLAKLRPRRDEIEALARAYIADVAPGAVDSIARMRRAGVDIHLVSGGIRAALIRLAFHVGLSPDVLHAVPVRFDALGAYAGYDAASPLTTSGGKREVVQQLGLEAPVLAVGDGVTDLALRGAVDRFVAFTGFVARQSVVEAADAVAGTFAEVEWMVLGGAAPADAQRPSGRSSS